MPAYKSENGKWYVSFYFKDIDGKSIKKKKSGFDTKKEALKFEREYIDTHSGKISIKFSSFVEVYARDMKPRLRYNTWITKEHIIEQKILPYFGDKYISEITSADVINWQNKMMNFRYDNGKGYSPTYLRSIHNQLSAIFNHAVKYYNLPANPVRKVGNMGKSKAGEMQIWTMDEYMAFSRAVSDNKATFHAFEILYWCGLRIGELLALTGNDFNFEENTIRINKSYQRLNKCDYITPPKTEKSNRIVDMPDFLADEMYRYIRSLRKLNSNTRIFRMSKNFLHTEMTRGADKAHVKRIRIHDLRHSHISLLISMGYTPVEIANRLGHESIDITLHYAHMFPSKQKEMAKSLDRERDEIMSS